MIRTGTHAGIRLEDLVDAAGRVAGEILQFPEGSIQGVRHDARLKPDPEIRAPLFHRESCTCQNRTGGAGRGVLRCRVEHHVNTAVRNGDRGVVGIVAACILIHVGDACGGKRPFIVFVGADRKIWLDRMYHARFLPSGHKKRKGRKYPLLCVSFIYSRIPGG